MATVKKKLKAFGRQAWQLFKWSIPSTLMYLSAGVMLMMLTLNDDQMVWDSGKLTLAIVFGLVAAVYNALVTYGFGGTGYEMLVSGNVKRASIDEYGGGFKMSSHKYVQEYRVWKGFTIGAFTASYTLVFGVLFGCNQEAINAEVASAGISVLLFVGFLTSGWTLMPLYCLNASGVAISYFVSCAFAIVPILVSGAFYILGAYRKRNKALQKQRIAEQAAAAEAAKEKKINYGGLPGTKPKKRK